MDNNEKEFARIVRENKRRIYTVCYMFSKDAEQVNDLFQDILINIWNGLKSFEGEKHLSTWIWRVSAPFRGALVARTKKTALLAVWGTAKATVTPVVI